MFAGAAHATEFVAGLDAGYAFRASSDGNNHGAGADAFVDVPIPGPLAVRPEVFTLAWNKVGLFAGALSLVYSFDDSSVQALASVGPLAGIAADTKPALALGALAALGLRLPVNDVVRIEARVALPAMLYSPSPSFTPAQNSAPFVPVTTFSFGVAFDFGALKLE